MLRGRGGGAGAPEGRGLGSGKGCWGVEDVPGHRRGGGWGVGRVVGGFGWIFWGGSVSAPGFGWIFWGGSVSAPFPEPQNRTPARPLPPLCLSDLASSGLSGTSDLAALGLEAPRHSDACAKLASCLHFCPHCAVGQSAFA